MQELDQLNDNLLREIEHFFVSYNEIKGKQFKPPGRFDEERAKQVVETSD